MKIGVFLCMDDIFAIENENMNEIHIFLFKWLFFRYNSITNERGCNSFGRKDGAS